MKNKTPLLLASLMLASTLSSCVVAPLPPGGHGHNHGHVAAPYPHSPYRPGGRVVTPVETAPRSPYSPGGRVVLPRERYTHIPSNPRSPGGTVVLPRGARPVVHRGVRYHTHGNTWYRPSGRGYVIVARPY